MIKSKPEPSLADKISGILSVTPAVFDPEDEDVDNTRAQIVSTDLNDENDTEEILLSKFRKQNVDLIADFDERYSGVKVSRKDLYGSDEEQSISDESDDEEKESTLDATNENESEDDVEEEENENDYNESGSEGSDSVEDDSSQNEYFEDENEMQESNIKTMSETDVSAQVRKGFCVRNQMQMWESLLEMRIQLQKSLIIANKMPQRDTFIEIKKSSSQEFSDQLAITKNSLVGVLEKLLLLQKLVLKKYPETKNLDKKQEKEVNTDEDEEIPSDTDEEKNDIEDNEEVEEGPKKRRKLNEFAEELSECHKKYKPYRNSVIQKWNEKTRIATMKNTAGAPSVLNHIEHILNDREKLIKRTQLKRSEYTILGQEPKEPNEQQEEEETSRINEYNTEIFDDDDFYHQLLRELIEVKSADLTDPVQLSRQWIQLQNLRSKMKRKIDTRATKGRKIRYAVHTKLVNFMAPIDENLWTEEAKNELFSSLFGKLERVSVV